MTNNEIVATLEAILFASGEPLETARMAEALELETDEVHTHLQTLAKKLDNESSGICLLRLGNRYQLCSRTQYAPQIRAVLDMKKNLPLSPAAFEVLAVVAYNQPVTKAYIEQIRGVDCSGVISTLIMRGLLEEKGRLDFPGRPITYGTTPDFLRCFCISSLSELPELPRKEYSDDEEEIDSTKGVQIKNFFASAIEEAETESEEE